MGRLVTTCNAIQSNPYTESIHCKPRQHTVEHGNTMPCNGVVLRLGGALGHHLAEHAVARVPDRSFERAGLGGEVADLLPWAVHGG